MNTILEEARIALHVVWRRRWLALGVAWGIALLGWLVISLIPNVYESKAHIYIEAQSILPQAVGISTSDQQQGVDAVRQTLLSDANLQAVVQSTDLAKQATSPRDMNNAIARLQQAISIKSTQDNLFEISADMSGGGFSDGQNAKLSQAVVQELVDLFVSGNANGGRNEALRSLKFLDEQVAQRGAQLQDADQKRTEFEQKYMGILPGTGSIDDRLATARSQLEDVETNFAAAQSAAAAVNGQLASTPATIPGFGGGGGGGGARSVVAGLQAQLAQDRAQGWTDEHPDVIALKNQIANMRGAAAADNGGGGGSQPNPMYVTLRSMAAEKQATAAALGSRRAQLQADIDSFVAKQASQPEVASQQSQLSRDYDVLKAQYDKLLSDREQTKLRADAQSQSGSVQVRVIDPANLPHIPAKPNRPLLLSGVLLLAIASGAGVAFLRAKLQTSYSTPGALATASGLPVLGAVSFVRGEKQKAREVQQLKWFAGTGGALVGAWLLLLVVEFVQRGLMA